MLTKGNDVLKCDMILLTLLFKHKRVMMSRKKLKKRIRLIMYVRKSAMLKIDDMD